MKTNHAYATIEITPAFSAEANLVRHVLLERGLETPLIDNGYDRPQVEERLTRQILIALQTLLQTEDVAISIDATHYCVKSRGIMDANSHTQTAALGGGFRDQHITRAEFLS
jgi:hypothetical protein